MSQGIIRVRCKMGDDQYNVLQHGQEFYLCKVGDPRILTTRYGEKWNQQTCDDIQMWLDLAGYTIIWYDDNL